MENSTSTESTKEIDEAFKFDLSMYPNSAHGVRIRRIEYKAYCNNCNSDDCSVYPSITE